MGYVLDLDNVCVDIENAARNMLAVDLGISPADIQLTGIYWQPFTHSDPDIAGRMTLEHEFWDRPELLASCKPMPGAVEAAHRLNDAGLLRGYVSRRPTRSAGITRAWLSVSSFPDQPLRVVGHQSAEHYHAVCKSIACRELGATTLIDDSQNEAKSVTAAGLDVILIDHPLGRVARNAFLVENPHIRLARDVVHAVDLVLTTAQAA